MIYVLPVGAGVACSSQSLCARLIGMRLADPSRVVTTLTGHRSHDYNRPSWLAASPHGHDAAFRRMLQITVRHRLLCLRCLIIRYNRPRPSRGIA